MKCNVSRTDKFVRVALSIALIIVGVLLFDSAGMLALIIPVAVALILLSTVLLSWCPIYAVLGWSTCSPEAQ